MKAACVRRIIRMTRVMVIADYCPPIQVTTLLSPSTTLFSHMAIHAEVIQDRLHPHIR